MIAYVKGKVIDEFDGGVVLENNGIGYEILCSATAAAKLSANKEINTTQILRTQRCLKASKLQGTVFFTALFALK